MRCARERHQRGKSRAPSPNAWSGKPLTDLHVAVMSMPMDAPGSLSKQEYADILADFLSLNGYPAGPTPLAGTDEAIRAITLDVKK